MKQYLRYFLVSAMLFAIVGTAWGQSVRTHKVKKNETIYGIAHANGITEAELRSANPGMERSDYVLKKGAVIVIPTPQTVATPVVGAAPTADDVRSRAIRMGIMLPLHDQNNDGRSMVEYYRGILMACDSLKREGISVDVYAWNTPDDADIATTLAKPEATQCDIIIGPFYSRQLEPLSAFCRQHNIMLLVPFATQPTPLSVTTSPRAFQVWQEPVELMQSTARRFVEWFRDANPVIVNCEDPQSTKAPFTAALRQQLDSRGTRYVLTSLSTADATFSGAFNQQKQNVVVLNSANTNYLHEALTKLRNLQSMQPAMKITIFGYPEWITFRGTRLEQLQNLNATIYSRLYNDEKSIESKEISAAFQRWYDSQMENAIPVQGILGFDLGYYIISTMNRQHGSLNLEKASVGNGVQSSFSFTNLGEGKGWVNKAIYFIEFRPSGAMLRSTL